MRDDLLPTQELHPAPSKAAVAEQAEEILRFARAHSDAEQPAHRRQENFEAGTTTS